MFKHSSSMLASTSIFHYSLPAFLVRCFAKHDVNVSSNLVVSKGKHIYWTFGN